MKARYCRFCSFLFFGVIFSGQSNAISISYDFEVRFRANENILATGSLTATFEYRHPLPSTEEILLDPIYQTGSGWTHYDNLYSVSAVWDSFLPLVGSSSNHFEKHIENGYGYAYSMMLFPSIGLFFKIDDIEENFDRQRVESWHKGDYFHGQLEASTRGNYVYAGVLLTARRVSEPNSLVLISIVLIAISLRASYIVTKTKSRGMYRLPPGNTRAI